jgi:hypothetical protein
MQTLKVILLTNASILVSLVRTSIIWLKGQTNCTRHCMWLHRLTNAPILVSLARTSFSWLKGQTNCTRNYMWLHRLTNAPILVSLARTSFSWLKGQTNCTRNYMWLHRLTNAPILVSLVRTSFSWLKGQTNCTRHCICDCIDLPMLLFWHSLHFFLLDQYIQLLLWHTQLLSSYVIAVCCIARKLHCCWGYLASISNSHRASVLSQAGELDNQWGKIIVDQESFGSNFTIPNVKISVMLEFSLLI